MFLKLFVPVVTLSAKDNQTFPKLLNKGFERSVYASSIEYKNTTNEYSYFLKSNFAGVTIVFVSIYLNQDGSAKKFNNNEN